MLHKIDIKKTPAMIFLENKYAITEIIKAIIKAMIIIFRSALGLEKNILF